MGKIVGIDLGTTYSCASVLNETGALEIIKNLDNQTIIKDLVKENESHIVCSGGVGGKGNVHFKSATQQTPRFSQEATKGEFLSVELELKVLADVGLVGLPNAGKSTLLSVMTTAKPKIADYPFTTLQPHLGIVKYGEYKSFVMADIPGLIEGASEGKGLGHQFLKHIERNKILLFMIDIEEPNPINVYNQLMDELVGFNKDLLDKDRLVIRTKIDTSSKDVDSRWNSFPEEFIDISSVSNQGLDTLKDKLVSFLSA